jgi:CRP-like cAMP-binding protein
VIDLVATRLRHADAREIAHAIELLEHELEPALAARVIPFLEPRPLRLRLEAAPPAPTVTDPLAALVALGDPYLRRAALLAFGQRLAAEHPAVFEEDRAMLPLVERIYFLRSVPLFHELSGEDLRQVAEIAGRRLLPAGGVVFKKGEAGDALFIVASGRVQVVDGGRALATLGQHEWFGELAVLDGEARSADAVCAEDSELLSLARADLEELIERRPEIARQIIRVLTRRLRDANLRLAGAA